MLEMLKSSETTLKTTLTSSIKTKTGGWRTHLTDNFNVLGPLHMSRLTGVARLPRSRLTPISFVKYSMCSYEKAGQPGYRNLGFYSRGLGNRDENFPI